MLLMSIYGLVSGVEGSISAVNKSLRSRYCTVGCLKFLHKLIPSVLQASKTSFFYIQGGFEVVDLTLNPA